MSSSPPSPPPHARPFHRLSTPRLIFRSALPSDVKAVCVLRSEPLNNPHGGVREADLSEEVQAERLEKEKDSTAQGKNAWVQVILKPELADHVVDDLVVEDGILVGMSGFNSFPIVDVEGKKVLTGDIGAMIDYRYTRKGYALETMEVLFEYGFNELECGELVAFTYAVNEPWRQLMKTMGLEGVTKINKLEDGEGPLALEAEFRFGKETWEVGKKGLKEQGRWYL